MKREWKPGDVAIATVRGVPDQIVMRRNDPEIVWLSSEHPGRTCHHNEPHVTDARPLVVLDPEDREQVERFVSTYFAEWEKSPDNGRIAMPGEVMPLRSHTDAAQAALRSLIAPPRPDEPTGLGAVVEDDKGAKFVRVADPIDGWMKDRDWQRIGGEINAVRNFGWSDITAVRILSEGVQPC